MRLYDYNNAVKLRHGVTQFIAEYTKQTYEEASENNCELIDWIIPVSMHHLKKILKSKKNRLRNLKN